jgi:endoribonuclease Nob1
MCAYIVADSSVFILGKRPEGEVITVPSVEAELKDIRSKSLLHIFDVRVESPSADAVKKARAAARDTGDIAVLSGTDLEVLAKAFELSAKIATDDYAVQNVALHLGLEVEPVGQPVIKRRMKRVQRCSGCGITFEGDACPDCGTPRKARVRRSR